MKTGIAKHLLFKQGKLTMSMKSNFAIQLAVLACLLFCGGVVNGAEEVSNPITVEVEIIDYQIKNGEEYSNPPPGDFASEKWFLLVGETIRAEKTHGILGGTTSWFRLTDGAPNISLTDNYTTESPSYGLLQGVQPGESTLEAVAILAGQRATDSVAVKVMSISIDDIEPICQGDAAQLAGRVVTAGSSGVRWSTVPAAHEVIKIDANGRITWKSATASSAPVEFEEFHVKLEDVESGRFITKAIPVTPFFREDKIQTSPSEEEMAKIDISEFTGRIANQPSPIVVSSDTVTYGYEYQSSEDKCLGRYRYKFPIQFSGGISVNVTKPFQILPAASARIAFVIEGRIGNTQVFSKGIESKFGTQSIGSVSIGPVGIPIGVSNDATPASLVLDEKGYIEEQAWSEHPPTETIDHSGIVKINAKLVWESRFGGRVRVSNGTGADQDVVVGPFRADNVSEPAPRYEFRPRIPAD